MRLAMVISDHGWGHLNRSLVTGAEALRRGHALAVIASPTMAAAIDEGLATATFISGRLDRGYVFAVGRPDVEATRSLLAEVAAGPEPGLGNALSRWAPDVVLADATPWAAELAHAIGVPAVVCSNFSWDDQYMALFGPTPETIRVREQMNAFDLALELPLGPGLSSVTRRQRVPLLSRSPGGSLPAVLPPNTSFVTWAMGRTASAAQPLALLSAIGARCTVLGVRLIVNEDLDVDAGPTTLPLPDASPWPDIFAASRVVITKAGYSTVAETLRGRGRLVLTGVTGLPEERAMITEVMAQGNGVGISATASDFAAAVLAALEAMLVLPPRVPEIALGELAILDAIETLVSGCDRE